MNSNDEIRRQAREILQGEEFQQYIPHEQQFNLMEWLMKHFKWKLPFEDQTSKWTWEIMAWGLKIVLVLLVVLILGLLIRYLYRRLSAPDEAELTMGITEGERRQAQASYQQLASEALKAQDYRLAIHYLFLACVTQVIQDDAFHATDVMTNREIAAATDFSRFSQADRLKQLFHQMVFFDEPRWFGAMSAGESEYHSFETFYRDFTAEVKPRHA